MLPQLHRQPWMDSDIETFRDQVRRYIAAEMAPLPLLFRMTCTTTGIS